jgi:hypothetical protein
MLSMLAVFAVGAVAASAASAEVAAEQQQFENAAGKEPTLKGFTSKEGVSRLTAGGAVVECKKDTDTGKLVGKESVKEVVVKFVECEEPTKKCPVKSTGATNPNEIVTKSLKGELGEVNAVAGEATSEVGLLLEGETSNVFVTLEGPAKCLPVEGPTAVEGSVVGEVTPLALARTDKTEFLVSAGAQKIKTFERSFAAHCAGAPVARECKEDKSFKPTLSAFGGKPGTFESKDENEFGEELKVNKGV